MENKNCLVYSWYWKYLQIEIMVLIFPKSAWKQISLYYTNTYKPAELVEQMLSPPTTSFWQIINIIIITLNSKYFLNINYVPATQLSPLHNIFSLNPKNNHISYYYSQLTPKSDEETKGAGGKVTCPISDCQ